MTCVHIVFVEADRCTRFLSVPLKLTVAVMRPLQALFPEFVRHTEVWRMVRLVRERLLAGSVLVTIRRSCPKSNAYLNGSMRLWRGNAVDS